MLVTCASSCVFVFFFNDTATTEIYTLSLHDALPICFWAQERGFTLTEFGTDIFYKGADGSYKFVNDYTDRKSTRLNSSHLVISYAVFCLKKKKKQTQKKQMQYTRRSHIHEGRHRRRE